MLTLSGEKEVRLGGCEAAVLPQPSKRLDNRACDRELRQSGDSLRSLGGDRVILTFAVPSPSEDSSSSDFPRMATCLSVDSEGPTDVEGMIRDFERRYHSSGTQNRKFRRAEGQNGLGVKGVSMVADINVVPESLEHSGE